MPGKSTPKASFEAVKAPTGAAKDVAVGHLLGQRSVQMSLANGTTWTLYVPSFKTLSRIEERMGDLAAIMESNLGFKQILPIVYLIGRATPEFAERFPTEDDFAEVASYDDVETITLTFGQLFTTPGKQIQADLTEAGSSEPFQLSDASGGADGAAEGVSPGE